MGPIGPQIKNCITGRAEECSCFANSNVDDIHVYVVHTLHPDMLVNIQDSKIASENLLVSMMNVASSMALLSDI